MKTDCSMKVIVAINGEISESDRKRVLETMKENLKNYSFLEAQIEAELVG